MSDKLDLKPIPFGSLNTYKASNAIEDSESTIAKNVSIDTVVGEIHPIGPFSQDKYPTAISCIFQWDGDYYVQCLNTLFRNKEIIYTLPTDNRLYFLPFTDTFGNNFLLFTDGLDSYKYDKESVQKLGIEGPTVAPKVTTNEGVLYRKYLSGIWAGCYASLDKNKFVRNKGFISTLIKDIDMGKTKFYSMKPVNNEGSSGVELYIGSGGIVDPLMIRLPIIADNPAIDRDDGKRDIPLFYLTLDNHEAIDWANINEIVFSFTSGVLFKEKHFRIWLMNKEFNYNATLATRAAIIPAEEQDESNPFPLPVCDVNPGVNAIDVGLRDLTPLIIKKFIVERKLLVGEDNVITLDLSDLTIEQKMQIKTLAIAIYYTQFQVDMEPGTSTVSVNVPDMTMNIEYIYADNTANSGPTAGNMNGRGFSWIYTYINAKGSESMASPPSEGLELLDQNAMIQITPSTDPQVTGVKLYRISETRTSFSYVATINNSFDNYIDSKKESELGEIYNSDFNGIPTSGLKGFTPHLNRVFAYNNNYVYYSEANNPEYWGDGISNKIQVGDSNPITGIASFGNFLFAIKPGNLMYIITPIGVDAFDVKNITIPDGAPYPDAIIGDTGAIFLGTTGIYNFASASASEISVNVRNKFLNGAATTNPLIFRAGNRIVCTNPGLVINTVLKVTTEIDIPDLAYATSINGLLYIGLKDGTLYYEDEEGDTYPFPYVYQSKEFQYNLPLIYKYGRAFLTDVELKSDDAEVTASFIADSKVVYSKQLKHGKNRFNLPPHYKGLGLQIKLEGKGNAVVKFPGLFLNQLPTDKSKF